MNKIRISTIVMLLFVAVMMTGCVGYGHGKPVVSDNPSYEVRKLFTVDGVTVYRFYDGGRCIYFTNGNGVVQYTHSQCVKAGKSCVPIKRNVVTLCNRVQKKKEE